MPVIPPKIRASILFVCVWVGVPIVWVEAQSTVALKRCAERQVEGPRRRVLSSDGEKIFLGTANGVLSAYGAKDLGVLWRTELGGEFASDLIVAGEGIVVVTAPSATVNGSNGEASIRLLGKDSGIVAWSLRLPVSEKYYLGLLNGGAAVVTHEGAVSLIDLGSGRVKWNLPGEGVVTAPPVFSATRLLFGTAAKHLIAIAPANGEIIYRHPVSFVPTSVAVSRNGATLAGDERGNLSLLSGPENKTVWRFKSGAAISSVVETADAVLLTSLDNFVYQVSDYNADVVWKRRLPARIADGGITLGGYFVVFVLGEASGYVIDTESGRIVDLVQFADRDLISPLPVYVNEHTFALTTSTSLEIYSIAACGTKQ